MRLYYAFYEALLAVFRLERMLGGVAFGLRPDNGKQTLTKSVEYASETIRGFWHVCATIVRRCECIRLL